MTTKDDPLLPALRLLDPAYSGYESGQPLVLHERPWTGKADAPAYWEENPTPRFSDSYYETFDTLDGPKEVPDAVQAITDGRVAAFLEVNPLPEFKWSDNAFKWPVGITEQLANERGYKDANK